MLNHRAFAECPKVILTTAGTVDLTVTPQTSSATLPIKFGFMHLITLGAANVTVKFKNDLNAGPYTLDFTSQAQLAGVSSVVVNSGYVEALLF